jgi:phenylacetic acid degradation operon negative regulatory protein
MELTARTLILDLLSTLSRGAMPVRALVEAGGLLGFAENNIRVTLSKLCSEGRVDHDERGSYRFSEPTEALSKQLRRWRGLEQQHRPWKGGWIAVHSARLGRGSVRRRRERALSALGFRPLEPGLYLRPDNRVGGVDAVRQRFLGIASISADEAGTVLVYEVGGLDSTAEARARGLWETDALTRGYRARLDELEKSRARLDELSSDQAMAETFVIGASVVRHLILDPLLPAPILDPAPRRALVEATREYDELGRSLWAPFLERHGVPHRTSTGSWRATHGALLDTGIKGAEA